MQTEHRKQGTRTDLHVDNINKLARGGTGSSYLLRRWIVSVNNFLDWDVVNRYFAGMGKGLSPLQRSVLAVLAEFPALEDFPIGSEINLASWARPRQLLQRLELPPTAANRAALSRALVRLRNRGLVASAYPQLAIQGQSRFYVRIASKATGGQSKLRHPSRDGRHPGIGDNRPN